jgi:hypothetical protein
MTVYYLISLSFAIDHYTVLLFCAITLVQPLKSWFEFGNEVLAQTFHKTPYRVRSYHSYCAVAVGLKPRAVRWGKFEEMFHKFLVLLS